MNDFKKKQAVAWCYTLNNWNDTELEYLKGIECRYHIMGKEVGKESKIPHIQGYIEFLKRGKRLTTVKKLIPRAHWEIRRGSAKQAMEYCKKDGNFIEIGEMSEQGKRTDLLALKERIEKGETVDNLTMENPEVYHQYGRTMNKIEDICMRKKFRSEQTKGTWIFGKTGVGKSHKAYENYSPDTHYNLPEDNGWWDAYKQQDTVVINEFRGSMSYGYLLQLADKWPINVKRRNREPLPFVSKNVVITSCMPPEDVYKNLSERDSLEQLYRRFDIYEMIDKDTMVKREWKPQGNYFDEVNRTL